MNTNNDPNRAQDPNKKIKKQHLPCPRSEDCGSSDAYTEYEDGHGFCYSCNKYFPAASPGFDSGTVADADAVVTLEYLPWRGVSANTMRAMGVQTRVRADGKPYSIAYRYPKGGAKVRVLSEKKFASEGDMGSPQLFLSDRFPTGSARYITVTEGEQDALSFLEMFGLKSPCVSVRSSSSAKRDCTTHRDYLDSFERIYLCLDDDQQGLKAAKEIAALFDFNKVYLVKLNGLKDATAYLESKRVQDFKNLWYSARRWLPDNVKSSLDDLKKVATGKRVNALCTYPFPTLQEQTQGIRPTECVLLTAQEGIGKTEILRAIEYHVLKTTEHPIGIIHLEESDQRAVQGLIGYELRKPVHLDSSSTEDIGKGLDMLVKRDDRLFLYSHFGSKDPSDFISGLRFLVAGCGCRIVFLDHITMVVSGDKEDNDAATLDELSTKMAMLTMELEFALLFVSHINDFGKTRGSRNISKIADIRIDLERNIKAEDPIERNTTSLIVSKNRYCGDTGPSSKLFFDRETFTVSEREF
jgi:twinkle protein